MTACTPRRREIAPVTAMDAHADWADDSQEDHPGDIASEVDAGTDQGSSGEIDTVPVPDASSADDPTDVAHEDNNEKWWSASLSDPSETASHEEHAPDSQSTDLAKAIEDARDETERLEISADDGDSAAEQSSPQRTITLDVHPNAGSAASEDAGSAASPLAEPESATTQKTFEIDIHPAASESHVVSGTDEQKDEAGPSRQFRVDVVREAAQALRTSPGVDPEPENPDQAANHSEPLGDDGFTIEFDEDELASELPGDAFADDLDEEHAAEDAAAQQQHDAYAPAIARTGTDDLGPVDPPLAGPGLDLAANASTSSEPGIEVPTGVGDLTPANWSSALDAARHDEPSFEASPDPDSSSSDRRAAPETDDHVDVPLPSDFEPTMDVPLPPWSPQESDDPLVSLDIPDPDEAPKLYEYDD